MSRYDGAAWLQHGYDLEETREALEYILPIVEFLRDTKNIDTLAFAGYSGIAMGTLISWHLNMPVIAIRKRESHDLNMAFGNREAKRIAIIDDFIMSGQTVDLMIKKIKSFTYGNVEAIVLYRTLPHFKNGKYYPYQAFGMYGPIPKYGVMKPSPDEWGYTQ